MHEARVMYEKRLVNDFTTKKDPGIYRYIWSLSGKPPLPSVDHFNSNKADSPLSIANLFNQFFHLVYNTSSSSSIDPPSSFPDISICNIDISMQDIFDALTSIQVDKAMGGDGIPPIILKGAATAILEPLQHIFQLCVKHSTLPKEWRDHYITPIFKTGDRSLVSNYRPISLLSSVSKLFEKLVFDKLFYFLIDTSISNSQFVFIKN
uniref:Reverse transcriptase domain-containing protein n=1 Tax=Amphimedon queenslandica TaxID=400682 RepID=A0A1X7VUC2_AMPQE